MVLNLSKTTESDSEMTLDQLAQKLAELFLLQLDELHSKKIEHKVKPNTNAKQNNGP